MALLTFAGFSLLGATASAVHSELNKGKRQIQNQMYEIMEILKVETQKGDIQTGVQVYRPRIRNIRKKIYGFDMTVELPKGYTVSAFRKHIEAIQLETDSVIRMKRIKGRQILLQLGMLPLFQKMPYSVDMVTPNRPMVPYYTPFGRQYLDFWDNNTCHVITAGATRMGKSVFLQVLLSNILLCMDGNVRFFYINNKRADWIPFRGIPQIPKPAISTEDAHEVLKEVFKEIKRRKAILDKADDCVNIQAYRRRHGNERLLKEVPPVFVVIDEYGRFAEDDTFQNCVTEIAETAGYLDIHLVIGTQRPDSSTVLKPRIRGNILPRVCFQTADEANSKIVVHTAAAFTELDHTPGRAIVDDGFAELAHIPYISDEQIEELLSKYRSEPNESKPEGFSSPQPAQTLPSSVPRPAWSDNVPRGGKTSKHHKPNHETTR